MKEKINVVLAGGGTKGSFLIGALRALEEKYDIDTITGTSVGALNSVYVAMGKLDKLESIWRRKDIKEVFLKNYTFGVVEGILTKQSLYSNESFVHYLREDVDLDELIASKIRWGCVYSNLRTYQKEAVYNSEKYRHRIHGAILASMAVSPAYPPVKVFDSEGVESLSSDGGYTEGVPVEACMDVADINLKTFIILCDTSGMNKSINNSEPKSFLDVFLSTAMLSIDTIFDYNVRYGSLKYWSKNKNNFIVIGPTKRLIEGLEFDPDKIDRNIDHGYRITQKHIQ